MRLSMAIVTAVIGWSISGASPVGAQAVAGDTVGLGGEWGRMEMLLERTFLKVDVLRLEVRVDAATADRIRVLRTDANGDNRDDEIVRAVLDAEDIWASFVYERDIDLDRLIDEIRKSMKLAVDAGMLDADGFEQITAQLPEWYASIAERGIRDGDAQYYRMRGDTLATEYIGREGRSWLSSVATERTNRIALVASWFAPGSDFRKALLSSLSTS